MKCCFDTLRVVDDLSMEFVPEPVLDYIHDLNRVYVPRKLNTIIVNSGTQPVAVKRMLLRAGTTCDDYAAWLPADLQPLSSKRTKSPYSD